MPSQWWYGGGTDITPSYVYDEDMKHFHGTYKKVCDNHDPEWYPRFQKWYGPPVSHAAPHPAAPTGAAADVLLRHIASAPAAPA